MIEDSLLIGFIGQKEQTGHPAQKPVRVIERLLLMGSKEGELVIDPMSGSGTTADAARRLGRFSIICDHSEEFTRLAEKRLGVSRLDISQNLKSILYPIKSHLDNIEDFSDACGYRFNSKDSINAHRNINRNPQPQELLLDAKTKDILVKSKNESNGTLKVSYLKAKRRKRAEHLS